MSGSLDEFVQLERTFQDLALSEEEGSEAKLTRLFRRDAPVRWPNLLKEPRVVLLSEAGSGKTEEIRHVCRNLRSEGKAAFFLRIEHLVQDFESCFEEGSLDEFEAWMSSGDEGWLLLDSVDEARLRNPKDFELAIRKLGNRLRGTLQRTHIVITGRTEAWRPKTDLLLCNGSLPWTPPETRAEEGSVSEGGAIATSDTGQGSDRRATFRIVALDDLHGDQVDRFAAAKGVRDIKAFKTAVERAEAWSLTTRPLDLAETVEFWNQHGRIGSRLELMRTSIAKRLEERDQDRSEARPITKERIREGARLVAAAATLAKESAIRVPDGQQNTKGLSIKEVLSDWDDIDCATLLTRPIFDEGIYGTVRFHHRSVREYLTAEWLQTLIVDEGSRSKIEALFFRRQYGIEVIVPTMRPVLPWLAILDQRILDRVVSLAPEVLFEGGDPSQLPLETRRTILRQTCEQLSQPAHGRSMTEYSAVQRFSNPDLATELRELLDQYAGDEDIVWFLLRMVWQGGIGELADRAKHFALVSRANYTRIAAIRAVVDTGSAEDAAEVREAILKEEPPLHRSWLAELLSGLPHGQDDIAWLLKALELAAPRKEYETDSLSGALLQYVDELPVDMLSALMPGFSELLMREPVVERHHCGISKHYSWLGQAAGQAAIRLVEARCPAALASSTLSILRQLPIAIDYSRDLFEEIRKGLPGLIQGWPELNRALFWYSVADERAHRLLAKGARLTDYWHVSIFGVYWGFAASDFDTVASDIADQMLMDDRLVALSLAFELYQRNGRPRVWRDRLKKIVACDPELKSALDAMLKRPARGRANWERKESAWKRRSEREAARKEVAQEQAREILSARVDQLREQGKSGVFTTDHHYLHEQMRGRENQHNLWTEGNWRTLIDTFGEPVARAFRDGAVAFWRGNPPLLRSEGAPANTIPYKTIFGLTGLTIEARETADWPKQASADDAETATRYALQELNGFPAWLPQLHRAFPQQVGDIVLGEIRHELATETSNGESHYALYDTSWNGGWLWDQIAPALLPVVRAKRTNVQNLGYLLSIIQRSSIEDREIAKIASQKANATRNLTFSPIWFAVWVGVDPDAAIPALAARLAAINDPGEQTTLALRFIVALLGGRSQEGRGRQAYRTVEHMKALYLLMSRYIREKEDIQRAGAGAYSPGLRDDAQIARNALFAFILETPGKEAFLALLEMARAHPDSDFRPWMNFHAKSKATADADVSAWAPQQVREFNQSLVSTPANHRELWYFAVDRLEALKHDLEDGDSSIASILQAVDQETEFRKYIGGWCRDRAAGRYNIPQEEELADAKRPDLRFLGAGFDAPVPAELKLADKWTGPHLFERLEVQLCGDYLRDVRSSRGIFVLVYLGTKTGWELPNGGRADGFDALVEALRQHWSVISSSFPGVEDIAVIGIDLTRRGLDTKAANEAAKKRKALSKNPEPSAKSAKAAARPKAAPSGDPKAGKPKRGSRSVG